jgi:hypothetical protein
MRLVARIDQLERRHGRDDERQAEVAAAAGDFGRRIGKMITDFTEADRDVSRAARACWSKAQELAWTIRFAPALVPALIADLKATIACR